MRQLYGDETVYIHGGDYKVLNGLYGEGTKYNEGLYSEGLYSNRRLRGPKNS